jgi:hypothetical protein
LVRMLLIGRIYTHGHKLSRALLHRLEHAEFSLFCIPEYVAALSSVRENTGERAPHGTSPAEQSCNTL